MIICGIRQWAYKLGNQKWLVTNFREAKSELFKDSKDSRLINKRTFKQKWMKSEGKRDIKIRCHLIFKEFVIQKWYKSEVSYSLRNKWTLKGDVNISEK